MEELTIRDMLAILVRQRRTFFLTSGVIFAITMVFVFHWSNYRSTATVQIEQSYIAANISNANATVETLADQRINQIQQKVTSLESLAEIITKFNLYPETRDTVPIATTADKLRSKIKVDLVSGNLSNPAAAQKQTAEQLSAIAFNLSFDYTDPQITQQVTDELVTRFLDEDLKQRRQEAQETSSFIDSQIKALENSMAEQEKAIADYRAKHGESGPAALMFNQQAAANLSMSLQNLDSQITTNEGIQASLRSQLVLADPYSRVLAEGQLVTTPAVQLKALQSQYATLTSQYGPNHPDVIKARRQIAALQAQMPSESNSAQLEAKIADIKTNLAAAKATKGANHPDVQSLEQQLKSLQSQQPKTSSKTNEDGIKNDADNPAYLQLASQLKSAQAQHKSLLAQRDSMLEQQTKYEQLIAANPGIEQEMAKLTRDYDNAQLRYREMRERKMAADMNQQLELDRKGQRLIVINPPAIPDSTQPKRSLLCLGALLFACIIGLSSVIIAEIIKQNVHGANHIAQLVGAPPLVIIPHMYTELEKDPVSRIIAPLLFATSLVSVLWHGIASLVTIPRRKKNKRRSKRY